MLGTRKIWTLLIVAFAIVFAPVAEAKKKKGVSTTQTKKSSKAKKKRASQPPRVKSNFTSWDRDTRYEGYRR
jgi:hypothetical protein